MDGDGKADLITWGTTWADIFGVGRIASRLEVFLQRDAGFVRYGSADGIVLSSRSNPAHELPYGARVADLNQDGLSNLVYFVGNRYRKSDDNYQWTGNWHYRLSHGDGFTTATQLTSVAANAQAPRSPSLVDDNGDGYPDFLYHDVPSDQLAVRHWLPGAGGFGGKVRVRGTDGEDAELFFTVDMNSDGNGDLLHVPEPRNGTETLKVYHHNTAGRPHLVTAITNGLGARTSVTYESLGASDNYVRIADLHSTPGREECFSWDLADGLRGLLGRLGAGGNGDQYCWTVEESALQDADAFYKALNDPWADPADMTHPLRGSLTHPLINTAGEAPILELMGPLYVVTQVRSSAPVAGNAGAMSGIGYVYERGKAQAAGRGLLGFRTLTTVDLQTGVRTTTTYRQDFPYIGLPLRTEVRTASGKLLRSAQNTWKLKGYDPAWDARTVSSGLLMGTGSARLGSLQPYIETSVEEAYDLPTTSNGTETAGTKLTTVTTVTDVDTYGNPTTITATTRDHASTKRFQQVTENTYGAESDTWSKQFGRLTKTKVTRRRNETANDDNYDAGLTASRTSAFTYFNTTDHKNGLLHTEVREPDDTALRHTTTYDYDAFGNRVKARVQAASGPAAGSSTETRCDHNTLEYDPYGRFVVKEWDCLGRLVRRMSTYNGHGLPAQSERVINSSPLRTVSTEYSYTDGGRLYFSRGADGSYTGTVWKACDSNCPVGAKYYIETRRAGGGVSREYRDALDRVVRTQVQGFDANTWITADTDYDHLGRVSRRSEPYHALADRHWTRYEYDLLGRVARTELPDYAAGSADSNSVITVSYAGRVATTTNALGQRQVQTRNALDEVIRTADHLGTTVTHAYNAWGQVTGTTTSGAGVSPAVVERDYDGRGRRTELRDPDRGTWRYEYNGFDELVKQTDAVGNVQALAYDGLGRLATRRDYRAGLRTAVAASRWVYDPANGLGQAGDVWELTDSGYRRSTTYDRLGRVHVTERQLLFDNERHYSRQTYDAYGRPHQHFDASRSAAT